MREASAWRGTARNHPPRLLQGSPAQCRATEAGKMPRSNLLLRKTVELTTEEDKVGRLEVNSERSKSRAAVSRRDSSTGRVGLDAIGHLMMQGRTLAANWLWKQRTKAAIEPPLLPAGSGRVGQMQCSPHELGRAKSQADAEFWASRSIAPRCRP